MADAKLTALTAASALAAADLFYVSQSAASRKATGTQMLALVGTTYVPLAGGTMTGALTLPAGTVSAPSLNVATSTGLYRYGASNLGFAVDGLECAVLSGSALYLTQSGASIQLTSTAAYGFSSGSAPGTSDVLLYRDAAATLAQRNGTTQQIFRLYNTYTDASNYERLTLTGVAGTSVNITAETLGTGGDNIDIVLTPAGTGQVKFFVGGSALFYVDQSGDTYSRNFIANNLRMAIGGNYDVKMGSTSAVQWTSGNVTAATDTALFRGAAGIVEVTNGTAGTFRDLKLRNLIQTEYHQMTEMTAPSAPAANSVRIYAEDNGAGKTRLMALFATGAAQQISIEP